MAHILNLRKVTTSWYHPQESNLNFTMTGDNNSSYIITVFVLYLENSQALLPTLTDLTHTLLCTY